MVPEHKIILSIIDSKLNSITSTWLAKRYQCQLQRYCVRGLHGVIYVIPVLRNPKNSNIYFASWYPAGSF